MEDSEKRLEELAANCFQWQEFEGVKNSKDCVLIKASALARAVTSWGVHNVEAVQSTLSDPRFSESFAVDTTDRRWWDVYYDFLLYFIHIADREAFDCLGEYRGIFMDRLTIEVAKICSGHFEDDKQAAMFKANFPKYYNQFQIEFGKYQRGPVNYSENLQFQFARRILTRFGLDKHMELIFLVLTNVTGSEIILNIAGLVTDIRWKRCGRG